MTRQALSRRARPGATFLSTSALARAAGVETSTIRFYERRHLLVAEMRKPSGYRLYAPEALRRVRFIRDAQALGLSLEEVAELLALGVESGGEGAAPRQRTENKLSSISRRIEQLERIKAALQGMLDGRRDGPLWVVELSAPEGPKGR